MVALRKSRKTCLSQTELDVDVRRQHDRPHERSWHLLISICEWQEAMCHGPAALPGASHGAAVKGFA